MDLLQAKKIMGRNFIGPEELSKIKKELKITDPLKFKKPIPKIPFSQDLLKKIRKNYILILGMPKNKEGGKLTINQMRDMFGWNPDKKEPCFYNQDWYLNEKFAQKNLALKWYLIRKKIIKNSKGQEPKNIARNLALEENFPQAILTAYTFFAYYFHTKGEILWQANFIWCSDKDQNGDMIYTGRYLAPKKINKNGFNVHRHLSIRPCYGIAPEIR